MAARRIALVAASVLALAGCGDRQLVLHVDVMSWVDPASVSGSFGPVPVVPGGLASGEQTLLDGLEIPLVDGIGQVASVDLVTFRVSAVVQDSTGSGADTLRMYLSDPSTDPRTTSPVLTLPVTLSPGVTDTVTATADGDARVAQLFVDGRLKLTLTTSVRGPESGDPLNGRFRVNAVDATVIASRRVN
jgi:hypothetical protein